MTLEFICIEKRGKGQFKQTHPKQDLYSFYKEIRKLQKKIILRTSKKNKKGKNNQVHA